MDRETVSIDKAAKIAGVCRRSVYNWIKMGSVESVKVPSGRTRIYADTILKKRETDPHEHCHDMVCGGNRKYPRGVKGHSCSCGGRDTVFIDLAAARTALAEILDECTKAEMGQVFRLDALKRIASIAGQKI